MLNVQNTQILDDFICPMQGRAFETKGGWATNDRSYAESTWFEPTPDERELYRKLVASRLCRLLAMLSATTIAEDFGIDCKEVVRLARWSEGKRYRSPNWLLVKAAFEELFEAEIA